MDRRLAKFFNQSEKFQRSHIGISIWDMETNEEIYGVNQNKFFVPASLQKIPLSAASLFLLGGDYYFKTDLAYEGLIDKNGTLLGNLWIKGGGDPSLPLDILEKWQEAIKKAGILRIAGKIIIDVSCFESAAASPCWAYEDLANYYGAGAFGLSINQNLYEVTFKPGQKEGDSAEVINVWPPISSLAIQNDVATGPAGSGDKVWFFGSEYSPMQFYRGTVPIDEPVFKVKGAIFDPPLFCANELAKHFTPEKGVEIVREKKISPQNTLLFTHHSKTLKTLLTEMNMYSINLYAEHLFKMVGNGKAVQGAQFIQNYLKEKGIESQIKDGSGLARTNYITPEGFTKLLCYLHQDPIYECLIDSFPEPDKDGTLADFPEIKGVSLKAKTGSMSECCNLGGYLILDNGKKFAFSIFCNNYSGPLTEIKNEISLFLVELSVALKKTPSL